MTRVVIETDERNQLEIDGHWVCLDSIHDLRALAILAQMPESSLPRILAACFDAGKECGKNEIREEIRPLINSMDAAARAAVETLGGILEQLPKEE